jgi:hypothetical protein
VAVLPADGEAPAMRRSAGAWQRWRRMVHRLQAAGLDVVDLAPALVSAPAGDLDQGADGTHYGPRASVHVAHALARALPDQRLRWVSRNAQTSLRDSTARGVSVRLKL